MSLFVGYIVLLYVLQRVINTLNMYLSTCYEKSDEVINHDATREVLSHYHIYNICQKNILYYYFTAFVYLIILFYNFCLFY